MLDPAVAGSFTAWFSENALLSNFQQKDTPSGLKDSMHPNANPATMWGLETEYVDAAGHRQTSSDHAIEGVLRILATAGTIPAKGILPSTVAIRPGHSTTLNLTGIPPETPVRWEISDSTSTLAEGSAPAGECSLPANLPVGMFRLTIKFNGGSGEERCGTVLLVGPDVAYQGAEPRRRLWALAVQLYGVRSHRNWGHGDFTDLLALIDIAADIGASGVGVNPLHALFDDRPEQASPYAPNSRLFINPLYIDLDAVPEFPGADAKDQSAIDRLQKCDHVDYTGVAELKITALHLAYDQFRARGDTERAGDFEAFKRERGELLGRFASFEVLRRRYSQPWWDWPALWRTPSEAALAELRRTDRDSVEFFEFVQWIADRQLDACQQRARMHGLEVGLYLDVAVGVDAGGADAWSEQAAILRQLSLGAPPDLYNTAGQNWGIAGFNPHGLVDDEFKPFRRTIAAAMRHAGAIRIDHVLGLNRLFVIPHGAPAQDGVYFSFPLEAMLAVVAQESVANNCIVVGEDLGTVSEVLRTTLADWGIWSYRVLMFEREADGSFVSPEDYPRDALATFNTHDLATYQGWMTSHDLSVRRGIGHPSGETDRERLKARSALQAALINAGCDQGTSFADVARYLAATPCRLVLVAIEDILGVVDQPNLPGTIDEYPNWRQRLPIPLEEWRTHLQDIAELFRASGRANPSL